ncbi:hypothetical protein [Campylobacter sp. RM16187]|uniref:hypothetical protein n=1 Tax=Campylobacter sp. RM16187 TaxID=1660063 RepID=UPI0021B535E7|nr:hypothetical protein [Campylobacter sp. RM16187]QKG30309.1 hypothetical protein CDOMF_b011 [Campylobacter sp. RM16187]
MVTSINIQTSNSDTVAAIKALLALDPEAIMTYENEPSLSEADQKKLEEIIAADERGEIKYIPLEEFDRDMRSFLKSLRA